jgi:hypothetical protein
LTKLSKETIESTIHEYSVLGFLGFVAEFREKGGKGIAAGEELNIFAGEFKVFFTHVPTSAFRDFSFKL